VSEKGLQAADVPSRSLFALSPYSTPLAAILLPPRQNNTPGYHPIPKGGPAGGMPLSTGNAAPRQRQIAPAPTVFVFGKGNTYQFSTWFRFPRSHATHLNQLDVFW